MAENSAEDKGITGIVEMTLDEIGELLVKKFASLEMRSIGKEFFKDLITTLVQNGDKAEPLLSHGEPISLLELSNFFQDALAKSSWQFPKVCTERLSVTKKIVVDDRSSNLVIAAEKFGSFVHQFLKGRPENEVIEEELKFILPGLTRKREVSSPNGSFKKAKTAIDAEISSITASKSRSLNNEDVSATKGIRGNEDKGHLYVSLPTPGPSLTPGTQPSKKNNSKKKRRGRKPGWRKNKSSVPSKNKNDVAVAGKAPSLHVLNDLDAQKMLHQEKPQPMSKDSLPNAIIPDKVNKEGDVQNTEQENRNENGHEGDIIEDQDQLLDALLKELPEDYRSDFLKLKEFYGLSRAAEYLRSILE